MKKSLLTTVSCTAFLFAATLVSCGTTQAPKADLKTDIDSLSYAIAIGQVEMGLGQHLAQSGVDSAHMQDFVKGLIKGMNLDPKDKSANARNLGLQMGQNINNWFPNLNRQYFGNDTTQSLNKDIFIRGLVDGVLKANMQMTGEQAMDFTQNKGNEIREKALETQYKEKKESNAKFLEENKTKEGVITTASGLQYKVITQGTGPRPTAADQVKVHYIGSTIDGKEFDNSVKRGKPEEFPVGMVIPGWAEGIQLMPVGSKYMFYIPYDLAYGQEGKPGSIDPYATLIFEVELLDITK